MNQLLNAWFDNKSTWIWGERIYSPHPQDRESILKTSAKLTFPQQASLQNESLGGQGQGRGEAVPERLLSWGEEVWTWGHWVIYLGCWISFWFSTSLRLLRIHFYRPRGWQILSWSGHVRWKRNWNTRSPSGWVGPSPCAISWLIPSWLRWPLALGKKQISNPFH